MPHPQAGHMREMEDFKLANHTYRSVWKLENIAEENDQSSNQQHHHVRTCAEPDHNQQQQQQQQHHHHLPHSNRVQSWNNNNRNKNYSYSSTKSASWINDPEVKRQGRVVKYKAYAVEGKMKASFRSGFRWVKNKYCQLVHGY